MSNVLYLHNGNRAVKSWAKEYFPLHTVMPCFTVDWEVNKKKLETFDSKLEYLASSNNVLFDLTPADNIDDIILAKTKQYCKVVKVVTSYDNDIKNLEDVWQEYNNDQWLHNLCNRLWLADYEIYFDHISLPSSNGNNTIFTPGRCGSHLMRDVVSCNKIVHHSNSMCSPELQEVVNSGVVFTVLRKSFLDFFSSHVIGEKTGLKLVTDTTNINEHRELTNQMSIRCNFADIQQAFSTITNFVDLLLSLKHYQNKDIRFCYYEDLSEFYSKARSTKVPYNKSKLIENYNEIEPIIQLDIQPLYSAILRRVESSVGLTIY